MPAETPPYEAHLQAFESLAGCRLCVHDHARLFTDDKGKRLMNFDRGSHRVTHAICGATDRELCLENCMHRLNRRIERRHERCFLKRCPRGTIEVVAPLYRGENHVGTLFAGMWGACHSHAGHGLPMATREALRQLQMTLPIIADGLLALCLRQQERALRENSRKAEIRDVISSHSRRSLSLTDLAAQLNLSPSRAGHLVKELFGESFIELLSHERLLTAQHFLVNSDYRMKEIALLCGMGSAEHFNRLFRQHSGQTPGEYRRRHRNTLI